MGFDIKAILLAALTSTAEQVEETSIEAGLQALHDKDPEVWAEVCVGLSLAATKLAPHVSGKFAAALVEGLGVAVKESQDANPTV